MLQWSQEEVMAWTEAMMRERVNVNFMDIWEVKQWKFSFTRGRGEGISKRKYGLHN